jgi:hypothetical protein
MKDKKILFIIEYNLGCNAVGKMDKKKPQFCCGFLQ